MKEVLNQYLERLPFWDRLEPVQRDLAASNASIVEYPANSLVHSCDNSSRGMLYVLKGRIRVYLLSEEGREITLYHVKAGECCVLTAGSAIRQINFETHMTAELDCKLLVLSSAAMKKLVDDNIYVKCFQYELTTERFSSVVWVLQQMVFARFDQRLAAFLVETSERNGSLEIRMTQESIAKHISSAREVVARMLKIFSQEGLVEIKRGAIVLKDVERLKSL